MAVVLQVMVVGSARGQTIYEWTNITGVPVPYFDETYNWSPSGPPGSSGTALFDNLGTYEVWWDSTTGDRTIENLRVLNGDVTFLNYVDDSNQYELALSGGAFVAAEVAGSTTSLTIRGIHLNTQNTVGLYLTTGATVVVDGSANAGSTLSNGDLAVSGALHIEAGGVTLGFSSWVSDEGSVIVTGTDTNGNQSAWNHGGSLFVGSDGTGTLDISAGGLVTNAAGYVGSLSGATGIVTVDGTDASGNPSTWDNSSSLNVGEEGNGTLNITSGGLVTDTWGNVGDLAGSSGSVTVDGVDAAGNASTWEHDFHLLVGGAGNGMLNVTSGGLVSNTWSVVGYDASSTGTVTVNGIDSNGTPSTWNNSSSLTVAYQGDGTLNITNGGQVLNTWSTVGEDPGSAGTVNVDGIDANGSPSTWDNSANLTVAYQGDGILNITNGGLVSDLWGRVGEGAGSSGTVTVDGAGLISTPSTWQHDFDLQVGRAGNGTLNITGGGRVSNTWSVVGYEPGSIGTVTVDGIDANGTPSTWDNSSSLTVAYQGAGTLNITNGGQVLNTWSTVGEDLGSAGTVTVDGVDSNGTPSAWVLSSSLFLGGDAFGPGGTGALVVANLGRLNVAGTLKIWGLGSVKLDGGTIVTDTLESASGGTLDFIAGSLTVNAGFELGTGTGISQSLSLNSNSVLVTPAATTIGLFRTLTIDGGVLETGDLDVAGTLDFQRGTLRITGPGGLTIGASGPFGPSLSIGSGQNLEVTSTIAVDTGATLALADGGNITAGTLANRGIVEGSGLVSASVVNQTGGLVRVQAGDVLTLADAAHTNDGDIQLQTGRIDFNGTLTNSASGNILGRGTLSTTGGLINQGDLALSNGQTDVFGDVSNEISGRVMVSGNSDVTFWDDVAHSGQMFNVSNGSSVTFFGTAGFSVSGGGDVFFEADITPGNSPGLETFGGNVHFGTLAGLEIELAGQTQGSEFDAVVVAGEAALGGSLDVLLLNGFMPVLGDTFEILTANGGVSGAFANTLFPDLSNPLLALDVFYETNAVTLAVVPALAGDYNADGIVDAADYAAYRNLLGQTGIGLAADGNHDGQVTPLDYDIWRSHYGQTVLQAASQGIASVPEPASSVTATLAIVVLMVCSRKHHHGAKLPRKTVAARPSLEDIS